MVHLVAFALEEERIEHDVTRTGLEERGGFGALKTSRRDRYTRGIDDPIETASAPHTAFRPAIPN